MDNTFERKLTSVLKEDQRPSGGIWYYVYLKPKWALKVWKHTEYPEAYDHPTVWENFVVPELKEHYKLTDIQVEELKALRYSMPRGRAGQAAYLPNDPTSSKWYISHGDDFPSSLSADAEKKTLVNAFNLIGPVLHNMVEYQTVDHEKMDDKHKEEIQKIIGKVPY